MAFSEMFHWTPNQIRSLNPDDKMAYLAMMQGAGQAKPPKEK